MTHTVRPMGRNRKATASSLTLAAGLLSLCYWGCAPDFDELNAGGGAGRGGAGANGGTSGRGGAANEGGAELGGRPDCGESGCAGSMSEGGSTMQNGGTSGHAGTPSDAGRGADAGAGGGEAGGAGGAGGEAGGSSAGDGGEAGGGTVVVPPATVRWDFEKSLQGWSGVGSPIPTDCVDSVTVSKDAAHNGEAALAMTFDGLYTPDPRNPYYGAASSSAPPPGAVVTAWMKATAPGVTAEWYVQLAPLYDWVQLTQPTPVGVGTWTEYTFTMPAEAVLGFGVKVYTALDMTGVIYLDHVSW